MCVQRLVWISMLLYSITLLSTIVQYYCECRIVLLSGIPRPPKHIERVFWPICHPAFIVPSSLPAVLFCLTVPLLKSESLGFRPLKVLFQSQKADYQLIHVYTVNVKFNDIHLCNSPAHLNCT